MYTEDNTYHNINLLEQPLSKGTYENCTFSNCDAQGFDFSHFQLIDCTFINCNLSLIKLRDTQLQQVRFEQCKMLGIQFDTANTFGFKIALKDCLLKHSSFYSLNLSHTNFENCDLEETDWTKANLTKASLANCNLYLAQFDQTNLTQTNFTGSYNVAINPTNNQLKKTVFDAENAIGLLKGLDIIIKD